VACERHGFDPDAATELDRAKRSDQGWMRRVAIVAPEASGTLRATAYRLGPSMATPDGASRFFYIAKPSKAERNAGLDGTVNTRASNS
jgi:hypothetical protein